MPARELRPGVRPGCARGAPGLVDSRRPSADCRRCARDRRNGPGRGRTVACARGRSGRLELPAGDRRTRGRAETRPSSLSRRCQRVAESFAGNADIFPGLPRRAGRRCCALIFIIQEHPMTRTSHAALAVCTLALGSLAAQPATAQAGFEGVITYLDHNKSTDKATQIVQTSKGHKAKFEGMGGANDMILIFDGDAHTMIMVQPDKKQYITITQADMDQMAAMMKPMADRMKKDSGQSKFKMDVTNTGRTETVAGTKCEVWHGTTVEEDGTKREGEACVAQGVGFALYD